MSHRTIELTDQLRHQVAVAAAYLNTSGSRFITAAIKAAILELAGRDEHLAYMLAYEAGLDFESLGDSEVADVIRYLRENNLPARIDCDSPGPAYHQRTWYLARRDSAGRWHVHSHI